MTDVKGRPSLRADQAASTRRRILGAAAEVFEAQGFAGTRIEDVAARAGVAVPTVYKGFASKPNLLLGAVQEALTGGDPDGAVDRQAWFTEQLDEPDPGRQLDLVARNARQMYERAGRLLDVLRAAAPLDPALAEAWAQIAADRLARSRQTARSLLVKAGPRARLPRDQIAETLRVLTEPELFASATSTGRSARRYEAWLADVLRRTILDR